MWLASVAVLLIAQSHDHHDHDHSAHGQKPSTLQDANTYGGQTIVDAAKAAGKVRQLEWKHSVTSTPGLSDPALIWRMAGASHRRVP